MLLSALYPAHVGSEQIARGFERLLESVDDLVLDVPTAGQPLSFGFLSFAFLLLGIWFSCALWNLLITLVGGLVCEVGGGPVHSAQRRLQLS